MIGKISYSGKSIIILAWLISSIVICGCGSGQKNTQTDNAVIDLPPSLQSADKQAGNYIKLSDKEMQELEIQVEKVSHTSSTYTVEAPGIVFPAPEYVSIISTPIDGRISSIQAFEGSAVKSGQILFKIESLEFGNMVSEYLQAVAEEQYQSSRLKRTEQLVDQTISSKSELERAQSDYQRASAAIISAHAKLKAIGVRDDEIKGFRKSEQIDPTLKIHSPITGILDQRQVELGQSVRALENLGRVINTKIVQVKGYLSPEDAFTVDEGDSVRISKRETMENPIYGKVTSVNPGLDESNRSVVVNILINTINEWPRPGENVRIEITTHTAREIYTVPLASLTYFENDPVVFVRIDVRTFEIRKIKLREIRNKFAVVESGLTPEEMIAVSQIFSLKAISRYDKNAE
jgi:RND family efflux transporter MFP subunit